MFTGRPGEERPGVCYLARLGELLPGEGVTAPPGAPLEVMDVSPQDPPLVAMDLSKRYNAQTRSRPEALDLAKKPEWYHRRPPPCGAELTASSNADYRTRSSYNSLSSEAEPRGGCMNSALLPRLDLYRDDMHTNMWHSGFYGPDQSGGAAPESSNGEESDSGSDVIFLVSSTKEPLLCGSFIQEDMRHMVAPLSPTVSSLDEDAGCYGVAPPLSSPSPVSSYSEESSDSSLDIPAHHSRPLVLLSDLGSLYSSALESAMEASSCDSDVISVADHEKPRRQSHWCESPERKKTPPRKVRKSSRIGTAAIATQPTSRDRLRRRAKNNAVGIYNESCDSDDMMELAMRVSSSDESVKCPKRSLDVQRDRASADEQQQVHHRNSPRLEKTDLSVKKPLAPPKSQKPGGSKPQLPTGKPQNQIASKSRKTSATKKPPPRRRRKPRPCNGPSALFPPREPEINLKALRVQAEKKEKKKSGSFCPFVRMEQRTCRVFNFQEEEEGAAVRSRGAQRAPVSKSDSVPNTSSFKLGRTGADVGCPTALRCCLCGETANATNMGDLHGPYRPDGPNQEPPTPLPTQGTPDRSCSPTVAPPPAECWIHEDCGVWCAGVFLVRGRLYGLREAAPLAQQAVCSCCQQSGAVIGCFHKGCASTYHYRCALQSGCFLNEDNFSMRCPQHKFKALPTMKVRR